MSDAVDNKTFAATDQMFRQHCKAAGIKPTGAQASKYRRKLGIAYMVGAKGVPLERFGKIVQVGPEE